MVDTAVGVTAVRREKRGAQRRGLIFYSLALVSVTTSPEFKEQHNLASGAGYPVGSKPIVHLSHMGQIMI